MRILLVTHGFPRRPDDPAYGFLLALARGQQALGHELLVVAPHAPGLAANDTVGGVAVARYRYGADAAEGLAYAGTMHEQVLRSWPARWRLLRLLAEQRRAVRRAAAGFHPDVVHVHWWFPGGLAVWPASGGALPVVLTSHGTDLFLLDRFRASRWLAARVFRAARAVTVISSPLVSRVEALGVRRERIAVIPMPVDAGLFDAAFQPAPGGDRGRGSVLFVGRLIEHKGCEFAIRAVAELRRRGRDVTLTVLGDGPDRGALERLASDLEVADRVRFQGSVPPAEVAAALAAADVFVLPAVTDWKGEQEGFGVAIVEAMLRGVPVVASASGGIPDVIRDECTGLLTRERDATGLAAAVERLLADPALARRLAAAARSDAAARFAPASIAARYAEVYRSALEPAA